MEAGSQVDRNDIFVGRAQPLEQLQSMLARTEEGKAQLVLIQGDGGIGKTHLARVYVGCKSADSVFTR
jgi:tRNA A37 threonylcarbamoyladenosine biosynthesis protein TsaE